MTVTLLAHTPEAERVVAAAAKLCYSPSSPKELMDGLTEEKTAAFVEMLAEIGHESPVEHAVFTFGLDGVSRALLAQITRHRIASFSVQSQRYVRYGKIEYVIPPEIEDMPEAREEFLRAMEEDQRHYEKISGLLYDKHIKALIAEGMDEKAAKRAAEKKAIEDARFVLPNACTTKMLLTMNVRSLRNFFALRCCRRAQWEIREVATEMLRLCIEASPELFSTAGPRCLTGPCPEGKMSCGSRAEVREFFDGLKKPEKRGLSQ